MVHEHPADLGVGDNSAKDDRHRQVPDFGRDVEDELSAEQRLGSLDDDDAEADVGVIGPKIVDGPVSLVPDVVHQKKANS